MANIFTIIPFMIISLFFLAIPILIGVYVYKDAEGRNMNKSLWALVAVFVPGFLGLVIYLLARNDSEQGYGCPNCGRNIQDGFEVCPNCGYDLVAKCSGCNRNVPKHWNICPWCKHDLPGIDLNDPFIKRRNGSKRVLTIVIIVLIVFAFLVGGVALSGMLFFSTSTNGFSEVESNWDNGFSHGYDLFNGTKSEYIPMKAGQSAEISYNTNVEKGTLRIDIIDSSGKVVETIDKTGYGTMDVKADQDGGYTIKIKGKRTKGYYNIEWNIH